MTIQPQEPLCHICQAKGEPSDVSAELRINCNRCDKPYCSTHASKVDIQFCEECVQDFVVEEKTIVKVEDDFNLKKNTIVTRKYYCTQVILSGTSWLFQQQAISNMSEEQLRVALRWHKMSVSMLESELVNRRIEENKKLQGIRITTSKTVSETKTTRVGRKKTIGVTQGGLESIAKAIQNLNMTPEQLSQLMQSLKPSGGTQ